MRINVFSVLWFGWAIVWATVAGAGETSPTPTPRIEAPVMAYVFEPVVDGETVVHSFLVRNQGQADLEIYKVQTG